MKNVLYIVDGLGFGGTQRYVIDLAKRASEFYVNPFVWSFVKGDEVRDELVSAKVPVIATPVRKIYSLDALKTLIKIVRFIHSRKIDFVHTFQTNPNIIGTIAGRLAGVPVITSRRDVGDLGMRGSWRAVLFEEMVINRLAWKITANSKAALNAAIENEKIPESKMTLIYNGIDFWKFAEVSQADRKLIRDRYGFDESSIVFGNVAVHRKVKSLDTLLEAFQMVHSKYPDTRLLMVGDGPERKNLENIASNLNLNNGVIFAGTCLDVSSILPAMDIFVLCSKSESFSNAILEAMATKLPVIATNVGGNPETVFHGKTGLLIPKEDPFALAKSMIELVEEAEKRIVMGENGQQRVSEYFSWKKTFKELEKLYSSIE